MSRRKTEIIKVTPADENHQVLSFKSSNGRVHSHRRKPCEDCPWRRDAVAKFPAEAFRISANTAYDLAKETFACHSSGAVKPATCAGFLLRGADHNLSIRMAYLEGRLTRDFDANGHELFDNYREMAIANGVDPDDPALKRCRD
ncbi:TPA: DUF6283 family protein [Pseudomonas aeruginosa]|uniref:DUF6283 family protein n=1 Tax=Pseudomonas aeruginosa TaxID=287 RepID=UPI0027EA3500|nr:hypothetical protein [Pseudomonas aeruginosa]EKY4113634.1 hypothetical protein [Pseudomonas aeruginosa]ELJ2276156.1 hypothetical protein [Pseudomonas aeruginosa]MBX6653770.1 hypothetical protein [Pseudomonas aeruginosa]MCS8414846.1 DUF6283 family protein [Pseudomonas aeruginosa]